MTEVEVPSMIGRTGDFRTKSVAEWPGLRPILD